jgi:hypothetical protein
MLEDVIVFITYGEKKKKKLLSLKSVRSLNSLCNNLFVFVKMSV